MTQRLPSLHSIKKTLERHHPAFIVGMSLVDLAKFKRTARSTHVSAIRNSGYSDKSKASGLFGCSWEEFKRHIESQFKKGMNWDNYGLWHVDHRIPLASATSEKDLRYLLNYMNLQPLWAKENLSKHDTMPDSVQLHLDFGGKNRVLRTVRKSRKTRSNRP